MNGNPPFVMSKYASGCDLYKAKAEYFERVFDLSCAFIADKVDDCVRSMIDKDPWPDGCGNHSEECERPGACWKQHFMNEAIAKEGV